MSEARKGDDIEYKLDSPPRKLQIQFKQLLSRQEELKLKSKLKLKLKLKAPG